MFELNQILNVPYVKCIFFTAESLTYKLATVKMKSNMLVCLRKKIMVPTMCVMRIYISLKHKLGRRLSFDYLSL